MKPKMHDTIIIGGGVAALGAALYAGRFEMSTLVISENVGGTIINTNDIANYPGFNMITGMDLIEKMHNHVKEYNVEFKTEKVLKIVRSDEGCFHVLTKDNDYHAMTVIIATGTEWRKLNVPGEKEYTGKGVHYCGLCDGPFYKDKVVAIVGGSDSAAKEALLLTQFAKKVYIIYRREKIRAEPINRTRVEKNEKIEIIPNTNVVEIKGEKMMTHVVLDNEYKGSKDFKLDGIFVEIGHIPLTGVAKELNLKLDKKGEIIVDRSGYTNVDGVFAAGDVVNTEFKQAITGVAEGVTAAYNAYHFLEGKEKIECYVHPPDFHKVEYT